VCSVAGRFSLNKITITLGLLLVTQAVLAETVCYPPARPAQPPQAGGGDEQTIYITAERSESRSESHIKLDGGVQLIQGSRLLQAEQVEYDKQLGRISAQGQITISEQQLTIRGERAEIDTEQQSVVVSQGHYQILGQPGRGYAGELAIQGRQRITLDQASYTTCPQGQDVWMIKAGNIQLEPEKNQGIARNMRLELLGVPVLYLPYINFPLGERKTGLLAPSLGSSASTGSELLTPFYWNIAPHRDATFTPRYMSNRGTQLQAEMRYLNQASYGQVDLEYLPNDQVTRQDRGYFALNHQGFKGPWQGSLQLQHVSDIHYLQDLVSDKQRVSRRLLENHGEISYGSSYWQMQAGIDGFQTVDQTLTDEQRPYRRLPYLTFNSDYPIYPHWQLQLQGEAVHFDRPDSLRASRLHLQPALQGSYHWSAGYLQPTLAWQATQYWLADQQAGSDAQPQRQLPRVSIDSGLWLERQWAGGTHQTFEPRLNYQYIPYRQQHDLARDRDGNQQLFDSGYREFDFDNLFASNRFTGLDRIGDENRLALSLTSRWYDSRGQQRLQARVGQARYLAERRVQLPGDATETSDYSNLLAALDGRIHRHWTAQSLAEWSADDDRLQKGRLQLRYQRDSQRYLNFALNYRRELLKQANLRGLWPLSSRWSVMADISYALNDQQTRDATLGLAYQDCCWGIRMAARRYINDDDGSTNTALALQFELRGLTSVGSNISGFDKQ